MKFPFPSLPLHTSHVHHTPKPSNQKPTSVFFSFRNDKQKNPKNLSTIQSQQGFPKNQIQFLQDKTSKWHGFWRNLQEPNISVESWPVKLNPTNRHLQIFLLKKREKGSAHKQVSFSFCYFVTIQSNSRSWKRKRQKEILQTLYSSYLRLPCKQLFSVKQNFSYEIWINIYLC